MSTAKLKIRYILEVAAAMLVIAFIAWGESPDGLAATYLVGIGLLIWVGMRHMQAMGRHWAWSLLTPFIFGLIILLCIPPKRTA